MPSSTQGSVSTDNAPDIRNGHPDGRAPLPSAPPDLASREMCCAAHLHPALAAQVLLHYSADNPRAWCPSFGVDVVALVRHAQAANAHWRSLYSAVAFIRFTLIALIALGALLLGLGGLATVLLSLPLIAVIYGVGWRTTYRSLQQTRAAAVETMVEGADLAHQVVKVDADLEEDLAVLQAANIIAFSVDAESPFVGSGTEVGRWALPPIDVSRRGGKTDDGTPPPTPFSIRELHDYLIRIARSRLGLENIEIEKRLYVRGDVLPECDGLLSPDDLRPLPRVDDYWVDLGSDAPGEQARTYVCLAKSLVGGEIVVTLFARCTLQQSVLSCEFAAYVLPPVLRMSARSTDFGGVFGENLGPLHGRSIERALAIAAWRTFAAELFLRSDRGVDLAEAHEERMVEQYQALEEGRRYDYGAPYSVRELASTSSIDSYFEMVDVRDCLLRMQRGAVDCLMAFLDEKGIDTSEIAEGRQRIINNITNIGEVSGTGNIFGHHGRVANSYRDDQSDE
ncbi:hypothetical protein V6V47_07005 [Micromonospora sp. CPCC 205539]|uniref:hypothetical protein n=1 Tax=Micromonospora sp. CPCC 205539 TaxID=3122408 RepID=UPI002FEEB01A